MVNETQLISTPFYSYYTNLAELVAVTLFISDDRKETIVFGGQQLPEGVKPSALHAVKYTKRAAGEISKLSDLLSDAFRAPRNTERLAGLCETLFSELYDEPQELEGVYLFSLLNIDLLAALEHGAITTDVSPAVRYWWSESGEFRSKRLADFITFAHKFGTTICSDFNSVWIEGGKWKLYASGALVKVDESLESICVEEGQFEELEETNE